MFEISAGAIKKNQNEDKHFGGKGEFRYKTITVKTT